jgi:hypothetical protein
MDAAAFAADWCSAWNAHDLERILAHFTEDVVFTSPVARQLIDGSDGVMRGKAALRDFWSRGLAAVPDLHFEIVGVYTGAGTVVINYRNQRGGLVNEVLVLDGDLVREGHGTYLQTEGNLAGAVWPATSVGR